MNRYKTILYLIIFLISCFPSYVIAASPFIVTSPGAGATVSGKVAITGSAGAGWVNVRAYVNGKAVTADAAPSNGAYTLFLDSTALPNGPVTLAIDAFSVPPGNPQNLPAQQTELDLNLNVQNTPPFTVTSPGAGATVSGKVAITGSAGAGWVNVRAYVNGKAVTADAAPSNGAYTLFFDSTALPNGPVTLAIDAFSVPPGNPQNLPAQQTELDLNLNVQNTPPFTVTSPGAGATVSGKVAITGSAGAGWVNVRAYVNGKAVTADAAPSNGAYTLFLDSTALPNGPVTLAIDAFSVPPGNPQNLPAQQTELDLNLNVQNTPPFTVTSPGAGATVSGKVAITGSAGAGWVNVRAYVNGKAVTADAAPSNGAYTLFFDSTALPNGPVTLAIDAFSVPPGNPQNLPAQQTELDLNLNVENPAALLNTPTSTSVIAGQSFSVTYNWNAIPMGANYTVAVHVVDSAGNILMQDDHTPTPATSVWSGLVSYSRTLTIPPTAAAGTYDILVGLYYFDSISNSWVNLPLAMGPDVISAGNNLYRTGTITVGPSADVKVVGLCGASSNTAFTSAPTADLCSAGTASAVTGAGPWSWTCMGSGGGTTANCYTVNPVHVAVPFDSSYSLVFDEEFNNEAVDPVNWLPAARFHDNTYKNTGMTEYLPGNVSEHDGCLDQAVTAGPTPDGSAYGTAGLATRGTTVDGQPISDYWEIRAKFADNAYGLASTFSTYVAQDYHPPEVDFFEYWQSQNPNITNQDYYYPACCSPLAGKSDAGVNLAAGYHVYGTWWTPSFIRFYIDGIQTQETTTDVYQTAAEFYGVSVFSVGPPGIYPNSSTLIPNHMYIDYIHVYSNQAGATTVPPQPNYGGPGDASGSTSCR